MPEEPVQIVLDDTLAADDANQIRSLLLDQYSGLEVLPSATTSVLQADLYQILPVAATVVATANLALTVFRQVHDYSKDRKTDIESFKLSLETELAKMGLVDGKILAIDNFASILDGGKSSCKVTVAFEKASRTVELYQILLIRTYKPIHGDRST